MPVSLVGELALWIALLLALWGAIVATLGRALPRPELVSSSARALHAAGFMLLLALLALATSLARLDLSLAYVAAYASANATASEILGALWSGSSGALLVLGVTAAGAASLAVASMARLVPSRDVAVAIATGHLVLLGLIVTTVIGASPFEALPWAPADGRGLPPLQRNPAALILPPIWAMASGAALAAFAIAIAAALTRIDRPLLTDLAVRWAQRGWMPVSAALVAALWWAYETGGAPAALSARVAGPSMLAAWIAFALSAHIDGLAGTRLRSSRWRLAVLGLPLMLLLVSVPLRAEGTWDPLHDLAHGGGGVWWIVMIAALAQLLGYALWRAPGIDPPSQPPHGYAGTLGSRLARAGALLLLVGLLAGVFGREQVVELRPGASTEVTGLLGRDWRLTFQGISIREVRRSDGVPRWREMLVPLAMSEARSDSRLVTAAVREYVDGFGRSTSPAWPHPAIARGLAQDIIVMPEELIDGDAARLRVSFIPVPGLIWLGGITLIVGTGLMAVGTSQTRTNDSPGKARSGRP